VHTCFEVEVPRLHCACCKEFDVRPEQCDCWPASPDSPQLWFTTAVLCWYDQLLLRGGIGAEGACGAALRAVERATLP
jgi:hypothetical protein